MAQKVFDQAEAVFEKLAQSVETDIVIRAEFLRGVLTFRRGDRDDAREIFRGVLERVPNVKLANQALFNLAEVYGSEERYIEQLNLLRTVGRLGRISKRRHLPGTALSIVVHDSDLGISRGHNRIPVIVTTQPGGDSESVFLTSAGAGKGLFRVDLETMLGDANAGDGVLQLTGVDSIHCDYPDEFKSEFKYVPLSDVDITIAASAQFTVASSRQCRPFGGVSGVRSVHPSSARSRSAFRWLHDAQQATQFSQLCAPPRLRGTTWSIVSAFAPQYPQRKRSRCMSAARVIGIFAR